MTALIDVATRCRQPEIMDSPDLDERRHRAALDALRRVNVLSASARHLWHDLRGLASRSGEPLRVLDLACGGGDVARGLERLARRAGCRIEVHGCDASAVAVRHARSAADGSGSDARFFELDVLADDLPEGFDVIYSTLFLHHLDEDEAVALLRRMSAAARTMLVAQDLIRSRTGFVLAWTGVRVLSRSDVARTDGPRSVRAAFTLAEIAEMAQRAGLEGAKIRRCWPQRFSLTWRAT